MVGPDGIPLEVWRSLLDRAVDLKMPEEWKKMHWHQLSRTVVQNCKNYKVIKWKSHDMKKSY